VEEGEGPSAGGGQDFGELYRTNLRPLLGMATALIGSRAQAEEVVQEAFARASVQPSTNSVRASLNPTPKTLVGAERLDDELGDPPRLLDESEVAGSRNDDKAR
jgi:hypothetical protein